MNTTDSVANSGQELPLQLLVGCDPITGLREDLGLALVEGGHFCFALSAMVPSRMKGVLVTNEVPADRKSLRSL